MRERERKRQNEIEKKFPLSETSGWFLSQSKRPQKVWNILLSTGAAISGKSVTPQKPERETNEMRRRKEIEFKSNR